MHWTHTWQGLGDWAEIRNTNMDLNPAVLLLGLSPTVNLQLSRWYPHEEEVCF